MLTTLNDNNSTSELGLLGTWITPFSTSNTSFILIEKPNKVVTIGVHNNKNHVVNNYSNLYMNIINPSQCFGFHSKGNLVSFKAKTKCIIASSCIILIIVIDIEALVLIPLWISTSTYKVLPLKIFYQHKSF